MLSEMVSYQGTGKEAVRRVDLKLLESRMPGNWHVRFGEGYLETCRQGTRWVATPPRKGGRKNWLPNFKLGSASPSWRVMRGVSASVTEKQPQPSRGKCLLFIGVVMSLRSPVIMKMMRAYR
jgi:hypothetical protein